MCCISHSRGIFFALQPKYARKVLRETVQSTEARQDFDKLALVICVNVCAKVADEIPAVKPCT